MEKPCETAAQAMSTSYCRDERPSLLPQGAYAIGTQSRPVPRAAHPCRSSEAGLPQLFSPRRTPGAQPRRGGPGPGTDRAEELSRLLQQAHQAALGEVAAGAHPVLIGRQGVVGDCGLLQHVGGNVLKESTA